MSKIAIHAGQPLDELLDGFGAYRSARLNAIAERYLDLVDAELLELELEPAEWSLVLEALAAVAREERPGEDWRKGWATVLQAEALAQRWGVDGRALALRVERMRPSAQCALWEIAAQYGARGGEMTPTQFLDRVLGAVEGEPPLVVSDAPQR